MTFENSSYLHKKCNFPKSSNLRELFLVDTPVLLRSLNFGHNFSVKRKITLNHALLKLSHMIDEIVKYNLSIFIFVNFMWIGSYISRWTDSLPNIQTY
jgi:hypothetical protein